MKANYADILHVRGICFFICFDRSFFRPFFAQYCGICNPLLFNQRVFQSANIIASDYKSSRPGLYSLLFVLCHLFLFSIFFLFVPFYFSGHIHDYTQYDE